MIASKSYVPSLSAIGFGELIVLAAAAMGSFYSVGRKLLSDYLNNAEISVLVMAIATLVTFLLAQLQGEKLSFSHAGNWHVILGLLIGIGFNIVATFLENYSFKHIDAVLGSQFLLTESLFAVLLGFFLYEESVSFIQILGGGLVILSVVVANKKIPHD